MSKSRDKVCYYLATIFGLGKSPIGPGTAGSLFALGLVGLWFPAHPGLQLAWVLVASIGGMLVCGPVIAFTGKKDPSEVIIDEVAGMFLTFLWLPSLPLWVLGFGFVLFRFFDITKPWLVGKAEKMPGAAGIMLDDLVAGIFANLILHILMRIF